MQVELVLKEHLLKTTELTDEQFPYVFKHFKQLSFKKGQSIIAVGDKVEYEYFALSGCLKHFFINDEQKLFILQFAMSNWWASDYNALYYQTKAAISVDCVTDTQVLGLSASDREKLCKE